MRKLFAFDIDGTLVDHKDHKIPSSALESIKELKAQGHVVGIATGRNKYQLQKVVDETMFDFIILCNGSYAEVKGKTVYNRPFDKSEVESIFSVIKANHYKFMITDENHLFSHHPDDEKVTRVVNLFDLITPDYHTHLDEKNIYQIIICEPERTIPSFKDVKGDFLFHKFGDFGYDIDQQKETKGDALKHICTYFSIDIAHSYAFGDADNDLKLIQVAGKGIAMGNAITQLKDVADYVTTSVGDNGIRNALIHLGYLRR